MKSSERNAYVSDNEIKNEISCSIFKIYIIVGRISVLRFNINDSNRRSLLLYYGYVYLVSIYQL